MKTVGQSFEDEKISYDQVLSTADISDWHSKSADFIMEKWNTPVENLSPRQYTWYDQFRDDLIEKRIERRL